MTMSDRIAILNHGELQQVGTPREVYNHPRNLFVAQFIGSPSMNVFDVTYESGSNGGRLVGDVDIGIGPDWAERIEAVGADTLKLGVRPEDVNVSRTSSDQRLPAHIDIIEPLGGRDLLYFVLEGEGDGSLVSGDATSLEAETAPEAEVGERKAFVEPESIAEDADEVFLTFDMDQAHVFDAESGFNVTYLARREAETTPSV